MYVFTHKVSSALEPTWQLALTADERTRSRYRYRISGEITDGVCQFIDLGRRVDSGESASEPTSSDIDEIYLELPRGTVLHHGNCLGNDQHNQILQIIAKPEQVLTVRTSVEDSPALLLRAAYHLGNRHVTLEVGDNYLRLTPDPVLKSMLHQLGVTITEETAPFQPESGAYGHHH